MNKCELVKRIENFAPLETAEKWDLSGWIVDNGLSETHKIMLCLTITQDVINQAKNSDCDMIISHHPLFFVPFGFNCGINMYCAHTNLDKASNGTTEILIKTLGFGMDNDKTHEYLRFCTLDEGMTFDELILRLKKFSKNIRYCGEIDKIRKIAFCSGSGTEFWEDALSQGADVLVTGDLKFHTALDSEIPIIDIGHFESEILVLETLQEILCDCNVVTAKEQSPITQII